LHEKKTDLVTDMMVKERGKNTLGKGEAFASLRGSQGRGEKTYKGTGTFKPGGNLQSGVYSFLVFKVKTSGL